MKLIAKLTAHREALLDCRKCPGVHPPVVTGNAVPSQVYLLGQAPGPHEGRLGKPFAYTAGRTLFRWFAETGVDEETFRQRVYMAAVLRCFPGKASGGGGDRVPASDEIARCGQWIATEQGLLQPGLVLPVGRLAIEQVFARKIPKLDTVVGQVHRVTFHGRDVDCIPLPHPSGLSTWFKRDPGKTLLAHALRHIAKHPSWRATFD
jgi:uracil-DNA glycosylase